MNEELGTDAETLTEEVARYLAAVDAFRAEDCEPTWRPELEPAVTDAAAVATAIAGIERSAH